MADESIVISVQDQVASSIAPKLAAIEANALGAMDALTRMQQAFNALDPSKALNAMQQAAQANFTVLNRLEQQLNKFSAGAKAAASNIDSLTKSMNAANLQAQQLIATLQGLGSISATYNQRITSAASGTHGLGNSMAGASALARELEGKIPIRAFERFLTLIPGVSQALNVAFPVLGAIAMIGVLSEMFSKIREVIQAFKDMGVAAIDAHVKAAASGERLIKIEESVGDKVRRYALLSTTQANAGTFEDKNDLDALKRQTEQTIQLQQARINADAAGKTGLAAQRARTEGIKTEIDNVGKLVKGIEDTRQNYIKLATEKVTVKDPYQPNGSITLNKITDPAQQKYLQEQIKKSTEDVGTLNNRLAILQQNLRGSEAKEPLAGLRDNSKQARLELKAINDELAKMEVNKKGTGQGGLVTAQDRLKFFSNKLPTIKYADNRDDINAKMAQAQQQVTEQQNRQKQTLDELRSSYQATIAEVNLYGDALEEYRRETEIIQRLQKAGIDVNSKEAQSVLSLGRIASSAANYHRILESVFRSVTKETDTYGLQIRALDELLTKNTITVEQYTVAVSKLNQQKARSENPLLGFKDQLQDQNALNDLVGPQRDVQESMIGPKRAIQSQYGDAGLGIYANQLAEIQKMLEAQRKQEDVNKALNDIYQQGAGHLRELAAASDAYSQALSRGVITAEQNKIAQAQIATAAAQTRLEVGNDANAMRDILGGALGSVVKDLKPISAEVSDILGNTLKQSIDGIADSFAKAITMGKGLGSALKDVALNAVTGLISSLIKLGLQWLALWAIQKLFGQQSQQTTNSAATQAAAAWAPAAYEASVATLGSANLVGGAAFLAGLATSTIAGVAASSFSKAGGKALGGLVRPANVAGSDVVPTWLTPGEFVMPTQQTRQYLPQLQAMREGNTIPAQSQQATTARQNRTPNVTVQHDGSTGVVIQPGITRDDVHIIAKTVVDERAPNVLAQHLNDPNSAPSKAITNNYVPRNRD